jgi:hypothetical protein
VTGLSFLFFYTCLVQDFHTMSKHLSWFCHFLILSCNLLGEYVNDNYFILKKNEKKVIFIYKINP